MHIEKLYGLFLQINGIITYFERGWPVLLFDGMFLYVCFTSASPLVHRQDQLEQLTKAMSDHISQLENRVNCIGRTGHHKVRHFIQNSRPVLN